jgi:hypothetical protein
MKTNVHWLADSVQDWKGLPVLGNMKTILRLLPVSLALCLCGCGAGYTFSPWTGPQSNWTTGPGGYVKLVDKVPLFTPGQYPPKPYILLGAVSTDNEDNLAKAVRQQHADAAMISGESSYRSGSIAWAAPGVYGVTPLRHTVITANLIKYK